MTRKVSIRTWPGRLSEDLAAAYLSISPSTFRIRVANGDYPQPVRDGARKFWARSQLDGLIAAQFGLHQIAVEDASWADLR